MMTNPAKRLAFSIGAGFLLALLGSYSAYAVDDLGWRIKFPSMVLVFDEMGLSGELHDNWHWAIGRMVSQYDSTDLTVHLDSTPPFTSDSTQVEMVSFDEPNDSTGGFGEAFALINNALVNCESSSSACGQDPQIVVGRVSVNVTNQAVKHFGGNNRRALVLHEFGHITGMGHPSCSVASIMKQDSCPGTKFRNLTGRDISLLNSFY
jgi:hypothetical protein